MHFPPLLKRASPVSHLVVPLVAEIPTEEEVDRMARTEDGYGDELITTVPHDWFEVLLVDLEQSVAPTAG